MNSDSSDDVIWQPLGHRRNVLLCTEGDPFEPTDLVNMFAEGVWGTNPETGVQWTGTFNVEHWRLEDAFKEGVSAKMVASGAGSWRGTGRTLQEFDRGDTSEVLPVVVFHSAVDPETRVCQSCGRTAGTPRSRS